MAGLGAPGGLFQQLGQAAHGLLAVHVLAAVGLDPDLDEAIVDPAVAELLQPLLVEIRQAGGVAVIEAQPDGGVRLVDVLAPGTLGAHGLKLQLMPGNDHAVGDD
ncbi:hypothetical protein D3C78_619770 [compost metagenome]